MRARKPDDAWRERPAGRRPRTGETVEITIGVKNVAREITLESAQTADQVLAAVTAALAKGGALTLTDHRGRRVVVPVDALGYVEIGQEEQRRVGFGAI
jgi:predicted methyltransferase